MIKEREIHKAVANLSDKEYEDKEQWYEELEGMKQNHEPNSNSDLNYNSNSNFERRFWEGIIRTFQKARKQKSYSSV